MATHTLVYPQYGTSWNPVVGFKTLRFDNSYTTVSRGDTVRRKKPVGAVALFQQGTSAIITIHRRNDILYHSKAGIDGTYTTYSMNDTVGGLGGSYSPSQATKDKALNAMLADARGKSVNIGQMLMEYRQTADLFGGLVHKFAQVAFVTLKLKGARSWPQVHKIFSDANRRGRWDKRTANEWLQFQYGVRPLMGDLAESVELLKEGLTMKPLIAFCEGSASERIDKKLLAKGSLPGGWNFPYSLYETAKSRVTYKGMYSVRNETVLAMAGSLGLTNPLALVWEAIPFSFVVDWWINIGEVIQSLDNPLYFDSPLAIQTVKTRYGRDIVSTPGEASYVWEQKTRTTPFGVSTFAKPRWKLSPSTMHIANGLALIRGMTKVR